MLIVGGCGLGLCLVDVFVFPTELSNGALPILLFPIWGSANSGR